MINTIKNPRDERGFALAELLVVVAIILVLVAIAIPVFNSQSEKARRAVDVATARQIEGVLTTAYMTGEIEFPNEKAKNGYKACAVVYVNDDGMTCYASGNVLIDGKDYQTGNGHARITQVLKSAGLEGAKLNAKKPAGAWNYYGVALYSDGKHRVFSSEDAQKNAYIKEKFEGNTEWYYNSPVPTNIEKAMGRG